ncbi:MAG: hypothetical protein JW841_07735 [Deltaproteobacteria bacterium]|nr:hypothetical protein [Deltaproteobacteria bacterium]
MRRLWIRIIFALIAVISLPWCWCGNDGPPRPPKASVPNQPLNNPKN